MPIKGSVEIEDGLLHLKIDCIAAILATLPTGRQGSLPILQNEIVLCFCRDQVHLGHVLRDIRLDHMKHADAIRDG